MIRSRDGAEIAFTRSGSGRVVVLVGGALQHKSDRLMGRLAPLLAKDFSVVSYDRRGRGDSTDITPYSIDREIEDLGAVIQAVGGEAYVFGNSSGGTLALLAAARLPIIRRVAIYEAPFIPSDSTAYRSELRAAVAAGERGKAVKLFLKRIGMPAAMTAIMPLLPMWRQLKALAPTLPYDAEIVGDGSIATEIAGVAAPVLVLSGSSSRMSAAADAVAGALPNATREVLKGQTHDVKPDVLASALAAFFNR